jgi:hypothetical protein
MSKKNTKISVKLKRTKVLTCLLFSLIVISSTGSVAAISFHPPGTSIIAGTKCGDTGVVTSIDLGCVGKGDPIIDAVFGIIRFLTAGVGIVIVASLVVAGIQYTASRGDPAATAKAIGRIKSTVTALLIFIFAAAIIDYVLPSGFLYL